MIKKYPLIAKTLENRSVPKNLVYAEYQKELDSFLQDDELDPSIKKDFFHIMLKDTPNDVCINSTNRNGDLGPVVFNALPRLKNYHTYVTGLISDQEISTGIKQFLVITLLNYYVKENEEKYLNIIKEELKQYFIPIKLCLM